MLLSARWAARCEERPRAMRALASPPGDDDARRLARLAQITDYTAGRVR